MRPRFLKAVIRSGRDMTCPYSFPVADPCTCRQNVGLSVSRTPGYQNVGPNREVEVCECLHPGLTSFSLFKILAERSLNAQPYTQLATFVQDHTSWSQEPIEIARNSYTDQNLSALSSQPFSASEDVCANSSLDLGW
jgi:hypothetical protein